MEHRNSFQELGKEIQEQHQPPRYVSNNIRKNIRFFHLFGDLIDLFFPKVVNIISNMLGSTGDRKSEYEDYAKPPNLLNKNQK